MKHLGAALLSAQRSIEALALDSRTRGGGSYPYASAEGIVDRVRDALHAAGLVLCPTGRTLVVQELGTAPGAHDRSYPGRGGEVVPQPPLCPAVLASVSFILLHPESGECMALSGAGAACAAVDSRGVAAIAGVSV